MNGQPEILRAAIFHTPRNTFLSSDALISFQDGGLLIRDGRVEACSDYAKVRAGYPDVAVRDLRGGFLLPGFVDTHIHYPQVRIIGSLGHGLLDWLQDLTLPEEARLANEAYAASVADNFVRLLVEHGTTTALVFGSHFKNATALLFESADRAGLRICTGLVLSDRMLRPELHQTADAAYRESKDLIARFHNRGYLSYAVTPRFALSASEPMLEVCGTLLREHPDGFLQTHLNEARDEIAQVLRLFPWAQDYLAVYERYCAVGRRSIFAHNVHATESELHRISEHRATVAHCPCSNAALGSGIFPLARHLAAGVRVALGTDVGGGTGFGILKEGLQAYLMQRLGSDDVVLDTGNLLYLATRAGAEALCLEDETGDFLPGKAADVVYLRAPAGSALEQVIDHAKSAKHQLAALFTLAGAECVKEVRVGGNVVFSRGGD